MFKNKFKIYIRENTSDLAYIEKIKMSPYEGAHKKTNYRTMAYDADNVLWHCSVFETMKEAKRDLELMRFEEVK